MVKILAETVFTCRHVYKKSSRVWQEAYHDIIAKVQDMMLIVYGAKLKLQDTFAWTSYDRWCHLNLFCGNLIFRNIYWHQFSLSSSVRITGFMDVICLLTVSTRNWILEAEQVTIRRWKDGHCTVWINTDIYIFPSNRFLS